MGGAPEHDVEVGPPLDGAPVKDGPVGGADVGRSHEDKDDKGHNDECSHAHGNLAHNAQAPAHACSLNP